MDLIITRNSRDLVVDVPQVTNYRHLSDKSPIMSVVVGNQKNNLPSEDSSVHGVYRIT